MTARLFALIAATLGLSLCASAQTMMEHSSLSTGASTALAAPTKALNAASEKVASKSADAAPAEAAPPTAPSPTLWEDKSGPAKQAPPPKPSLPAVFVLANGERVESNNYFMTVKSVRIEQDGKQRTIPMSAVNVDATMAANRQRGVNLKFPTSKTQITLSF